MSSDFSFYAMLALLFTHELDAIKRHEWRILPLTSFLPDRIGEQVFIWLHIPLFLAILWFAGASPNSGTALFLSAFSIAHIGMHWLFRNHPRNEFNTPGSWILIIASGAFGALHLVAANI